MQKELKNVTENIMSQIHQGKIKMRPKLYFIIGSVLTFLGLVFSVITSVFLVGLIRFSLRIHGPVGQLKLGQMISNFPWWITLVAIAALILGIWLVRQYDFSYKNNPWLIIFGFILVILVAGWLVDMTGLNDKLSQRGPMKGIMQNCLQNKPCWRK